MPDETLALLALTLVPGLGPQRVRALRRRFGSARAALAAGPAAWRGVLPGRAPVTEPGLDAAQRERSRVARVGARLLSDADEGFPTHWEAFDDLPPLLYVRGRWPRQLGSWPPAAVAVVGSRRADAAALAFAEDLGRTLASAGVVVVSGLAYGIDGAAHRGALQGGAGAAPTVAVVAGGVDRPGPSAHQALARQIVASGGAVVSEAAIGSASARGAFPRRNRLVAALARSVVVVAAGAASGAQLTAGHAARYGRDVFVVPAHPWDEAYAGSLALLADGATPLCSLEEAPSVLAGVAAAPPPSKPASATVEPTWAWDLLSAAPIALDLLVERSGRDVGETLVALERLVHAGHALVDDERRYRRR